MLGLLPQMTLPALTLEKRTQLDIENLRFDDHVDMTGKTVEILDAGVSSDNAAVLTLEDNFLVASGVGAAKVRVDGNVYNVTVEKAKINLIMIMGQSNAGNHFDNATSDVTCPVGTAYWWGNNEGVKASEPVAYTQPSKGFHTPLLAELYAQSVAAGDPVKNVMIWHEGITSKNGQSILKWAASATDTSGTDDAVTMLEKCRAYYEARSDHFEIVSSGIYWLQGESDVSKDPSLYRECFMAMWHRLKDAGMEYVAFLRVRRGVSADSANKDDLYYSASLSAQIQMINDTPEFYMATTITENWIGTTTDTHTVDISPYITMVETYGQSATYTDQYGNDATYSNGKLTTTMKALYGSNNRCHYGKFGYGVIGADAAYNMYRALHGDTVKIVVTDTSGYASRRQVLTTGQNLVIDISEMTDDLVFRGECGNTGGTLQVTVRSGTTDITNAVVLRNGIHYGAMDIQKLRAYENVSVAATYTTAEGVAHTAVCTIQNGPVEPKRDYIWDFDTDLYARDADGEILNAFLAQPLAGGYTLENGYLTGDGLQLELENIIALYGNRNWCVEWKYGALNGGTAGFLLCSEKGNSVGNKGLWHTIKGNFTIADYLDRTGYRNYTSSVVQIRDYDRVTIKNTYDPITEKSTISLYINGQLAIADMQLKGSLNDYHDQLDMTEYPLNADFLFRYLGNTGMAAWTLNCQLDYLKISFGDEAGVCENTTGHNYANAVCTRCGTAHPNLGNYQGKVISILGDSISTFAGYIPTADGFNLEHLARYPQDNLLTDVNETWWMQVIAALDAKLGINDSWRGATVSGDKPVTTGSTGENAAMGNLQRIRNLGANGTPDVILFYGGTNDLAHVSKIGTFSAADAPSAVDLTTTKWDNLADGYVHTLLRLQYFYPNAQIIAMLPTYTNGYYSNEKLAEGNAVLAAICEHYGVTYVDLRECGISVNDLPDNIHPNAVGMDYISTAVVGALMNDCKMEAGENVVHSVTHKLLYAESSLGFYNGVSRGAAFVTTISGKNMTVSVTMDGVDITAACYRDGVLRIPEVTGNVVITAEGVAKPIYEDHLQKLPDSTCCQIDLWAELTHDPQYYTANGWDIHSSGKVYSVTFPVNAGDQIFATSFGVAGSNGGTINGIRVTWFDANGVLVSMGADAVYEEFVANGYLSAPEGAVAVCIPMWSNSQDNRIYILNCDHIYENGTGATCNGCGASNPQYTVLGDLDLDGDVDAYDLTLLARHVGGIELLTDPVALQNADVDGDGDVDAYDLTIHARYVGGIITDWYMEAAYSE